MHYLDEKTEKRKVKTMPKQDSFDYRKAMEDYDKSIGKEDTDLPLKYTTTSDGGVDYLAASRAYENS